MDLRHCLPLRAAVDRRTALWSRLSALQAHEGSEPLIDDVAARTADPQLLEFALSQLPCPATPRTDTRLSHGLLVRRDRRDRPVPGAHRQDTDVQRAPPVADDRRDGCSAPRYDSVGVSSLVFLPYSCIAKHRRP
jgi:hypothetical protein